MNELRFKTWHRMFVSMCDRHVPVEVIVAVPGGVPSDRPQVMASRLLRLEPDRLCIEGPCSAQMASQLGKGSAVTVLAVDEENRVLFDGEVLEAQILTIDGQQKVAGLWLSGPHNVRNAQDRGYYRVGQSATDMDPVLLIPPAPGRAQGPEATATGRCEGTFRAVVCNISGGGLGVEVPVEAGLRGAVSDPYRCILRLPTMQVPIELPVEVVRVDQREDGLRYLGLQFNCRATEARHRQYLDNVSRYTTWYQRRSLQQRRGRAG